MELNKDLIKKINILFHEIDATFFDKEHKLRHVSEAIFWNNFIKNLPQKELKVIDVASGTGFIANLWQKKRKDFFVCSDITLNMLITSRKKFFKKQNIHFVNSDATCLPFKNETFDIALINAALHHIPDYKKALLEMSRILKINGILIIAHEPNLKYYNSAINRLILKTSRSLQWYLSPSTYIEKIKKKLNITNSRENMITDYINKKLSNIGYNQKLTFHQIMKYVDIHSAEAHLGFNPEKIINYLPSFKVLNCLFFDYCGVWLDNTNLLTKLFGKLIKRLVGETNGRRFTIILKKKFKLP